MGGGEVMPHTPGPWKLEPMQQGYFHVSSNSKEHPGIAQVLIRSSLLKGKVKPWEESEANARLISCAPELLEALKALLDIAPLAKDSHTNAIHRQAEQAIAKAEGK